MNIAWQACRAQKLPGGGAPACLEEKKALDRAKAQLVYIEDKIVKTRKWGDVAERQASEYKGRASQLQMLIDSDLPKTIALMDRVITSLEAYVGYKHTGGMSDLGGDALAQPGSVAQPAPDAPAAEEKSAPAGAQASKSPDKTTESDAKDDESAHTEP